MDIALSDLAGKLVQLPEQNFINHLGDLPLDQIGRMQQLDMMFKSAVIDAQLLSGGQVPLSICIVNLKAKGIENDELEIMYAGIEGRLRALVDEGRMERLGLSWEILRKILFIFLDKTSQISGHFQDEPQLDAYNPYIALLYVRNVVKMLSFEHISEDLMECIGRIAEFVTDRIGRDNIASYFQGFGTNHIKPHLSRRVSEEDSRMQKFATACIQKMNLAVLAADGSDSDSDECDEVD